MNEQLKDEKINLNKADAAKRLFKEATILYFERRDPVAIHHLVHASHEILNRLTDKSFFLNKRYIKPEFFNQLLKAHSKSKNFIKHADRDRDEILEFNPNLNYLLLLDCAIMIHGSIDPDFTVSKFYLAWCALQYPSFFVNNFFSEINNEIIKFDHNDFEFIVKFLKL